MKISTNILWFTVIPLLVGLPIIGLIIVMANNPIIGTIVLGAIVSWIIGLFFVLIYLYFREPNNDL